MPVSQERRVRASEGRGWVCLSLTELHQISVLLLVDLVAPSLFSFLLSSTRYIFLLHPPQPTDSLPLHPPLSPPPLSFTTKTPSALSRKQKPNIPSSLPNPSLTLTPQSLNFACAALSWLKDVVRCCSSCVSWFFTLLSWAVGREERSTVSALLAGGVFGGMVGGCLWGKGMEGRGGEGSWGGSLLGWGWDWVVGEAIFEDGFGRREWCKWMAF